MHVAAFFRLAALACTAAGVAGCGAGPGTIAADDAALCHYAAEAGAETAGACRDRLQRQQRTHVAANAGRIDGLALLNAPAAPTELADRCKHPDAPKECGDVTGTIRREPGC